MKKRIICIKIAVIAIMLFGVFGLTACDNISLADYKATKSQALQDYADAKSTDGSYCESGLAAICNTVTEGKKAIEDATNKACGKHGVHDSFGRNS